MEIKKIHTIFLNCKSLEIDTRKIQKNSIFVALGGARFDGNTFTKEALERGASYVIIDDKNYFIDNRTILVENSLITLQKLASFHRMFLNIPIIALTGSNGKTTTKELINVVLEKKFNVIATKGNLNNHIGVPLTLLSFNKNTEIGIVEMGANHQKEIEFLCEIAKPDYGYITNFGKAHLEGFCGVEGVIKGKSEMYNYLIENHKIAFVNLDDAIQNLKTESFERATFSSIDKNATTYITSIEANPLVKIKYNGTEINSNLIGLYNANNVNCAITIGKYFGVSDAQIKAAIESYVPENNRSQLLQKGSNEIILDAYNANPSSMEVALNNFIQLKNIKNKIVIIGDMFELGNQSLEEHKFIISILKKHTDIKCYFVGDDFYANKINQSHFNFYKTFEDFSSNLKNNKFENKLILIKGSRGMALERTLDII